MQGIDFEPQVENVEEFQRRKQAKQRKLKQIDQIQAFNAKTSKIQGEVQKPDQFDSSVWDNFEGNKNVNMFQLQGKQLLSDKPSVKKLESKYLFADQICNLLVLCLVYFAGYPFWFCLLNIVMVIGNTIHLSYHVRSESLTELNKNHKRHRMQFNRVNEWIIILSIATCTLFLIRTIIIVIKEQQKLVGTVMSFAYMGIIYFQLKLLSNLKYIILLQKQLSKGIPQVSDYAQSFQFG